MAFNSRWLLGHVEKLAGTRLDPIVLAGGGANSPIWGQIFADVLERTVPIEAVTDLFAEHPGEFVILPFSRHQISKVRHAALDFEPVIIPAGSYPGQDRDIDFEFAGSHALGGQRRRNEVGLEKFCPVILLHLLELPDHRRRHLSLWVNWTSKMPARAPGTSWLAITPKDPIGTIACFEQRVT